MAKRIFLADSRQHIVKILEEKLEKSGYDVILTTEGKDIVRLLNINNAPNLIMVEAGIPAVDIVKICQEIKSEKRLKEVPVLIMKEAHISPKPFVELGIKEFLNRPCDVSEVLERIDGIVNPKSKAAAKKALNPVAALLFWLVISACVALVVVAIVIPLFSHR